MKKGAAKSATKAERDAVSDQKQQWAACYRLLAAVGRSDAGIAALLSEASAAN